MAGSGRCGSRECLWRPLEQFLSASFHSLFCVDPEGVSRGCCSLSGVHGGERRWGLSLQTAGALPSFPSGCPVGQSPRVCGMPLSSLAISLPFSFPSGPLPFISAQRAETRPRWKLALTGAHNTHGHTHLSQSMSLCLALCSWA